ncbi:MAG TPA: small multi-drug resistant family protein [Dongiaceae bacterium]|nr:small multi-drug resistant family protein [Dongiaceae bacterium]
MSRFGLIALILASVSINAAAQLLLRWAARDGLTPAEGWSLGSFLELVLRPGIVGGLACYVLSVVIWVTVLSRTEVSFAYPFLGVGFVLVTFASVLLLGEAVSGQRLAGTALIAVGVAVLARS